MTRYILKYRRSSPPYYLRGWSPGHHAPIGTKDPAKARRFRDEAAFRGWWVQQQGAINYAADPMREFELALLA